MNVAALAVAFLPASALAAVQPMFQVGDPASFGTQIAQLDAVNDAGYAFDPDGFSSNGYVNEPFVGAPFNTDATSIVSTVFRVDSAVSFNTVTSGGPGTLNLNAGDLVFEYRIRLTSAGALTVDQLTEFQANALGTNIFGTDGEGFFDESIVKGRGFSVDNLVNPDPAVSLDAALSDLQISNVPGVIEASSQSWEWDTTDGLANGEEIRLLLFTTSALIVNGEGFLGGEASTNAGVNPQADEIPILVPAIPAPGTVALVGLGACVAVRRRR